MTGGPGSEWDRAEQIGWLVKAAVAEDVGAGDFTTLWTLPPDQRAEARVVAKERAVVAGIAQFSSVFALIDDAVRVEVVAQDGAAVDTESVVIRLEGSAQSLLTAERVALNFLGRLSGIATQTRRFVDALSSTGAKVVDTRKTTPGWRSLEKAAVRAGGGSNHRMGLYDMVLIKDNHIDAAGGIARAIRAVKKANDGGLPVEVEVSNLAGLEEVLAEGVDRILLDNMTPDQVSEAVHYVGRRAGRRPELEASGNITLETVRSYGEAGVDFISVGALTHSAPSADFSMRMGR